MPWFELISIALLAVVAVYWLDSIKVREVAVREARAACQAEGFQFLDDTVASTGVRLMRDEDGRLSWHRAYSFEYSDTGNNRRPGSIVLLGQEVLLVNVGLRLVN